MVRKEVDGSWSEFGYVIVKLIFCYSSLFLLCELKMMVRFVCNEGGFYCPVMVRKILQDRGFRFHGLSAEGLLQVTVLITVGRELVV